MRSIIRRPHLTRVIYYGLVVFYCTPASVAAQVPVVRDLGTLGETYSFPMDMDNAEKVMSHAFAASNAVQRTTLTRTSGGNSVVGALGSTHGLAIGIDNSGPVVGYAYRVHSAVEHATMFSTSGRANIDLGTPGGAYSYARDIDINLWWAVPH